eukprot:NODE_10039_length_453_cov_3.542079_g8936_i0.p2 GENE.NODE_10039_length_453_cov_3.542079_g8936_i0~~NODE_10039_length_453_cov_3.542079_g8936_i0.p2  ORF type:complete len:60 (-),score=2.29 NODE_10039_length_453_cov_3.542079_g8936_i0:66-245(-)
MAHFWPKMAHFGPFRACWPCRDSRDQPRGWTGLLTLQSQQGLSHKGWAGLRCALSDQGP